MHELLNLLKPSLQRLIDSRIVLNSIAGDVGDRAFSRGMGSLRGQGRELRKGSEKSSLKTLTNA